MSVASQWKLKEKEAAAAAASTAISKTGIPGARGKTETPIKEVGLSGGGAAGGPVAFKGQVDRLGKLETAKPGPPQATPFGKQGASKLPVGKDTLKSVQTKEADAVHVKNGAVQPVSVTPGSKIPVGAKENNITSVGGRKPFGAGLKKEEPAVRSKAEDGKVKTSEPRKDPAGGAKDSSTAVAAAAGDDGPLGSGRTKGLAGFWANQNDEVKTVKKKRLTAVEENLTPIVVESTPQQLEGVVRAHDPSDWKKPPQVEDGWTKNVVSSFQKRQQESFSRRAPISLVEDTSYDAAPETEVKVKDISQRLTRQQSEPTKQVKEKLVIDRSQGAIVLAENQPMEVDPDVVRSDDGSKEEVVLEKGRTRNLLQLWKNTEVEYNTPKTSTHRFQGSKPAWILEIEAAKGNSSETNGEPDENNATEVNDEGGGTSVAHSEERHSTAAEATERPDGDTRNVALDTKACVPLPREFDKSGEPILEGSTEAETIEPLKPRNDETYMLKLGDTQVTIKKESQCIEAPTTEPLVIAASEVRVAEALPDLFPCEVEMTAKLLVEGIIEEAAHVELTSEAPLEETIQTSQVCKQANEYEQPADGKEALRVSPEETKPTLDASGDVPSSLPDTNKTLQESAEGETELQKPSPKELTLIQRASEIDSPRTGLPVSESSGTTFDKQEPNEQSDKHEGDHSLYSMELKPNDFAEVSRSDSALNFTDVEYSGAKSTRNESDVAVGPTGVAVSAGEDVAPINFVESCEKPEDAPNRISDEVIQVHPETHPVGEANKGEMTIEEREESSDHETFATPTKSVIVPPLGFCVSATQAESCDSETARERTENAIKAKNESSFTEGTLIDLQAESIETRREKLSLFSLDDLLQLKTSPDVDYISSDNTPCLVPLSSPSTPELNISSERSSGVFDSDSEKCTVWFSPQEETSLTTAKTETISMHDDQSAGSLKSKTGDETGPTTESNSEQTNKAEASQRSCLLM